MTYGESKIYFDGSHYIAIPHTTRPSRRRHITHEETIAVIQDEGEPEDTVTQNDVSSLSHNEEAVVEENIKNNENCEKIDEKIEKNAKNPQNLLKIGYLTTRKDLFNELYKKYINLSRNERKRKIVEEMSPYFKTKEYCELYVEKNFERKLRNLICRKVRMTRKANLANFNYFCTFTYDSNLHTEQSFKKKLQTCFKNLCYRNKWKYMGVWERSPKNKRLHFHGLFNIPDGTMPGKLSKVRDYDTVAHKMQECIQSSYFNERFGRSDFKELVNNQQDLARELAYLMKYIEKSGEKIVYSKGLAQYFISDVVDSDIVSTIGQEEKKFLLFDDFKCWDEGVYMGKVSPEVIEQMRKSN